MTLTELIHQYTQVTDEGFAVVLDKAPAQWDEAIRAAGRREAYRIMARELDGMYRRQFGRDFLFSEKCMTFELGYHVNAYMAATGHKGYPRHVSTLLFSKAALVEHCRSIEISTEDIASLRQRLMFGYRSGVRKSLRGTVEDPFRRFGGKKTRP